ncbi:MAG: rod shape-determining protein MreD [Armatimonadota bacterium]
MATSYVSAAAPRSALYGFIVTLLLLLVCVAAQSTWAPWLRMHGQVPELALAAVLSIGLTTGGPSGLLAGFLGAFLWASVTGLPVGNLFISYMTLGFLAGTMRGRMFSDRVLLAAIVVMAAVIVASVIGLLIAPPPSPQSWVSAVLFRAVFSGLLTIPVYSLMRFLSRYYPEPDDL